MNLVPCHLYHLYMVFAFFAVLITYFGVNFLLGGMREFENQTKHSVALSLLLERYPLCQCTCILSEADSSFSVDKVLVVKV